MAINFIHMSYKSLSFLDAVTSLLIPVVFLTFKLIFESSMDIMFNLLMQHWNGFFWEWAFPGGRDCFG